MIDGIIEAMKDSIQANDWMTQATKEKALQKLGTFLVKIGFPDKWKDYSALILDESDSLFDMKLKVYEFEYNTEFAAKINSVKDKMEWGMLPHTVNACYHPLENSICFPGEKNRG